MIPSVVIHTSIKLHFIHHDTYGIALCIVDVASFASVESYSIGSFMAKYASADRLPSVGFFDSVASIASSVSKDQSTSCRQRVCKAHYGRSFQ